MRTRVRITEGQLRRIIREELDEATLADVEPDLARQQSHSLGTFDEDPHTYIKDHDITGHRRNIKRLWNKHADLAFFNDPQSLFVWHYLGRFSWKKSLTDYFPPEKVRIGSVPGIDVRARDELSCYGRIVSNKMITPDEGSYFTFKEYRVTFASKSDVESERLSRASPEDVERLKSSGLRKRPYPGVPFRTLPIDRAGAQQSVTRVLEEVIIDNWIIDTYYIRNDYFANQEAEYAEKLGLNYKIIK
jgi:hypothetical protein